MKDKNKKIILIIGIVSAILLVSGITYSWFKWRSSNNATVSITIDNSTGLEITFDGGQNITGILEPTLTKEEGIVKNFSANTNGLNVPMNICLKINTLPNDLKDSTFKWELYKGSVLLNSGDFSTEDLSLRTDNGNSDYYLVTDVISDNTSNYTLYLWIDGNFPNNVNMASKSIDFDLYGTVSSTNTNYINAASYINYLYTKAEKTVVQNNNINYHYATSVGLMNDRLGGTTESLDGGNIRYYGANPNNYVWLGDTYTSAYTFDSNGSSVTRNVGDKKLWRIIGVFDRKLKLISNDPISNTSLSWDTSENNTTGGNSGKGINEWSQADLMRLLNPGYEEESINNSLYWNKGTGTVYTGSNNATTANVSFANTGLSNDEKDMIDTTTWYLGAYNGNASYSDVQYAAERQGSVLGGMCTPGDNCNDEVTRTTTWNGKVGLIYPSDYGYATDFNTCGQTISFYSSNSYPSCPENDWIFDSSNGIYSIISLSKTATAVYYLSTVGYMNTNVASTAMKIRSVIYLKPEVIITSGTGTETNPYVLELS